MSVFACPKCGGALEIADAALELQTRCAHCGQSVTAPSTVNPGTHNHPTVKRGSAFDNLGVPAAVKIDFLGPPQQKDEMGRMGRYRVLRVLGAGGMGVVFQAEDVDLLRPVALKCLLPALAASEEARHRFVREARAAAAVEHDHIVVIYQVGEDHDIPFLAMQLLLGESLETRIRRVGKIPPREILRLGREMAEGLAAAHGRGLIHRDIKPGNVWLEGPQARVKLLDFGLARAITEDTHATQAGAVLGTPAYMAPEQVAGESTDERSDLFSLGSVLYEMCTGQVPFPGKNTTAVLLAVTHAQELPAATLNPNIPAPLSELLSRLLAKDPRKRLPSARAVVEAIEAIERSHADLMATTYPDSQESTATQVVPIATTKLTLDRTHTNALASTEPTTQAAGSSGDTPKGPTHDRARFWVVMGFSLAAVVIALAGALRPWLPTPAPPVAASSPVEFGIAYGTEKKRWFESAVQQFTGTAEGKDVKINLLPRGSLEGAQTVLQEDKGVHVWAPASSLFRDHLVSRWQKKHGHNPILKEENLSLTPLVFVFWEPRLQAFLKKYETVDFATIGQALKEPSGWGAIASQPEWGSFKFSHTDPEKSNSGLMSLIVMAHEFHRQAGRLTPAQLDDPKFQEWVTDFEKHVGALSHSTGTLMEDMVRRGPSSYDALLVYENVVIDYFNTAQGRWGKLAVAYPPYNLWSDHPYYLLDVPWSSPEQRRAAEAFLRFLMSEPMQRAALTHGFRPSNVNIAIQGVADSPFTIHAQSGLKVALRGIVPVPGAATVDSLLTFWSQMPKGK
jgi:serine/threonine protein kinase